jgi:hypothetical protein
VTEPAGGRAGMHFQALSFGDVDGRVWGGALDAGGPAFAFGDGETTTSGAGSEAVRWTPDGRGWRLTGEGFDLHMEPGGEELPEPPDPDPGMTVSGMEELCRVQGTLTVAGAEHAVDCVGTRWMLDGVDVSALHSLRAVSGWFASDQALAVLSLRSRRSSGHESDLIAATLFDPDGWVPVKDPRLSTTYAQDGAPARVNLELWVGDEEEEYPRRAAGEAAGGAVSVSSGDFALRVAPMRCHSRGQAGAGVYVLATFA